MSDYEIMKKIVQISIQLQRVYKLMLKRLKHLLYQNRRDQLESLSNGVNYLKTSWKNKLKTKKITILEVKKRIVNYYIKSLNTESTRF